MPVLKDYHVFISHAWKYGDEYNRLVNLLNCAKNFSWKNYSAPSDNPLKNLNGSNVTNKSDITNAIKRKILPSNIVLVISGMYANNREWMEKEIQFAQELGKPIIAIKPFGNTLMPTYITIVADTIVGWNTDSIVSAIRYHSI